MDDYSVLQIRETKRETPGVPSAAARTATGNDIPLDGGEKANAAPLLLVGPPMDVKPPATSGSKFGITSERRLGMSQQDHPEFVTAQDTAAGSRIDAAWAETDTDRPGQRAHAPNGNQSTLYRRDRPGPVDRPDPVTPSEGISGIAAGACLLVVGPGSGTWRRRLGAQAWSVLEQLALAAHHDGQGWATPVGVRGLADELGITKDTAARAVNVLVHAGIVALGRVEGPDGQRRSGYRIRLPEGIYRRSCLGNVDANSSAGPDGSRCPVGEDEYCPNGENGNQPHTEAGAGTPVAAPSDRTPNRHRSTPSRTASGQVSSEASQPSLFSASMIDAVPATRHA